MSAATAEKPRYRALDTYRFLAASGIVFYHFENHFAPLLPAPTHALERFHLFVDFFFVLSGFVIMHTYGARIATRADYLRFLRKRLARIYPLHLATIALFCAIGGLVVVLHVPVRDRSFFDVSLLPAHLLLVHAWGVSDHAGLNVPSWSISAEWFVYLLFPLLAVIVRRSPWLGLVCAAAVAAITEVVRHMVGLTPGDGATIDFGNLRAVPSFLAGMGVFVLVDRARTLRLSWTFAHGLALATLALMLAGAPAIAIVAVFPVLVGAIALAERADPETIFASRAGVVLGHASFAIYMIHTFFQVGAVIAARTFGVTNGFALIAISLVTYGAIVVAGVASYRWFEDPLRRRLSRSPQAAVSERRAFHAR